MEDHNSWTRRAREKLLTDLKSLEKGAYYKIEVPLSPHYDMENLPYHLVHAYNARYREKQAKW